MRDFPAAFKFRISQKTKEYRFVVGIVLDVDSIYLTSHGDIDDVPGTVINGVLAEPVIQSQRLRPDEARAEIGSATFTIIDVASQFTDEVRERLADSVGLRGVRVRFYFGFAGDAFDDLELIGTQKIVAVEYQDGRYSIECADIQRTMRENIFEPISTTLSATLTAGDTTIQVSDATAFEMVYHSESFTDAPLSTLLAAMRRAIERAGGAVHTSTPVERVTMADGRVTGVQVAGRVVPFSRVVITDGPLPRALPRRSSHRTLRPGRRAPPTRAPGTSGPTGRRSPSPRPAVRTRPRGRGRGSGSGARR